MRSLFLQILLLTAFHSLGNVVLAKFPDEAENYVKLSRGPSHDLEYSRQAVCQAPFVAVGEQCLHFYTQYNLNQQESRGACQSIGGNLVAIHNATQLKNIIDYILANGYSDVLFWVDGSDADAEGEWKFASGLSVPMGTPFWDATESYQQPDSYYEGENCLSLEEYHGFLFNDKICELICSPLCEQPVTEIRESKVSSPVSDYCPQLYVQIDDACVAFILWAEESWVDARQTCHSLAGELAIIDDIELMRSIIVYIHQEEIATHSFWIGGSDRAEEGVWMWENGNPVPIGQPFWGTGEPWGGSSENCLAMNTEGYHFFRDKNCDLLLTPMCIIN